MKIRWLKKEFVRGRLRASNNCCKGLSGLGLLSDRHYTGALSGKTLQGSVRF